MKKLISLLLLLISFIHAQDSTSYGLAVVLSGGGLRGTGHIGVLRALEEDHVNIDLIVGSSVGALVGGLYCAGYSLDQIENILLHVNWNEIYIDAPNRSELFFNQKSLKERAVLQVRFSGTGAEIPRAFSSGQKLRSLITKKVLQSPYGNRQNFDNYRIPLRIVSTNFISGEKTIFRYGDLAEVIHGSIAVPLLYEPVEIDSSIYVDGGLSDNLPIDVAKKCGAKFVIASDLTSPLRTIDELNTPWEIADQVTGIMMQTHLAEKREKADILIRPNLNEQTPGDWGNIPETIHKSYETALTTLNQYKDTLSYFTLLSQNSYYRFGKIKIKKSLIKNINFKIDKPDTSEIIRNVADKTYLMIDSLKEGKLDDNNIGDLIDKIFIENNCPYVYASYSLHSDTLSLILIKSKVRNIIISGNKNTKDIVIKRELELNVGSIINYQDLLKSYDNVYNTDLFRQVGMHLKPVNNSNLFDLNIKVSEKKSNLFQLGLRYDNTRFSKTFLEFSNQNIFGYGIQNNMYFELGELDRGFKLGFNSDRIGYSKITAGANLYRFFRVRRRYNNGRDPLTYNESRNGVGMFFGWQIERLGRVVLWGIIENLGSSYDVIYKSDKFLFTKIQLSSIADRRNSKIYPQTGNNNVWSLNIGHYESSESKKEFIKFFLQLSEWYKLHKYHTIGILFQNGLADNNLPYEDFFEWGGWDKMPGFVDREFAGRTFWLLRINYRAQIPLNWPGDYFFHLGLAGGKSSISSENYLKFDNMVYGIMAGISIRTLVGPLRLSYGYNDTNTERVYLSIGFPF